MSQLRLFHMATNPAYKTRDSNCIENFNSCVAYIFSRRLHLHSNFSMFLVLVVHCTNSVS